MAQLSVEIAEDARTHATPTLYNNLVKDIKEIFPWKVVLDTWTYSSDFVLQVGNPDLYKVGQKMRWTYSETPMWRYGIVARKVSDLIYVIPVGSSIGDYKFISPGTIYQLNVCNQQSPDDWPSSMPIVLPSAALSAGTMTIASVSLIYGGMVHLGNIVQLSANFTFTTSGTATDAIGLKLKDYFNIYPSRLFFIDLMYRDGGNWVRGYAYSSLIDSSQIYFKKADLTNWGIGASRQIEFSAMIPLT